MVGMRTLGTFLLIFCVVQPASSWAVIWYVRDGGGAPTQCTGLQDAVYPGSGSGQPCALANPMYVLGAGCGNTGFADCDAGSRMQDGDTLSISGDSDLNPGAQAQYPIGMDPGGDVTPSHGNNCFAPAPMNCTMANLPPHSSIIGTGKHRPQLWAREQVAQVLNDNASASTLIRNLEITQHSACVYNGADTGHSTDGFPNRCPTPNGASPPFGNWGISGLSLAGKGITLENCWIHGMGQWGITTGSLEDFTEKNNIINGNGGGGVGLGQNNSGGSIELKGTTTVSHETIVFNGCGSHYPLHSSDPMDTANYHNCADDNSSNGTILADGWAIESSRASCRRVVMTDDVISFNTKGGIDNLHCDGSGAFYAYRVTAEGNESQQIKINYARGDIENSRIINDCNFFQGQPFVTPCGSDGSCPPSQGYDFCRAAGNGLRIAVVNDGIYRVTNSTLYSDGGANVELPPVSCNSGSRVSLHNNLVINAADFTDGSSHPTSFYENDTGSCNPVSEDYNLVYQSHPPQCSGGHDICNNPTNAGVTGNFTLNGNHGTSYTRTDLSDQFYPDPHGPLAGAADSGASLSGPSNDCRNSPRPASWDIGACQHQALQLT